MELGYIAKIEITKQFIYKTKGRDKISAF